MNAIEHLLTCLAEEGSEITKDACKSLRFGLDDRNVLNPTGPTNRERLVDELNDLEAVRLILIERGAIPKDWCDVSKIEAKQKKVLKFMEYAERVGTLK